MEIKIPQQKAQPKCRGEKRWAGVLETTWLQNHSQEPASPHPKHTLSSPNTPPARAGKNHRANKM